MEPEIMAATDQQSLAITQQITAAEVDMQVATAKKWPRSIDKCLKDAKTLATKTKEIAEGCFYVLPRGGKSIVGPSVRLAEILASTWGNLRCESRIVEEGARHVVAQATVWDMQTNVLVRQEVRRRITNKSGHRYNDDMINTTANAATSIALRNALLRVVPRSVVDDVFQTARQTAVGDIRTLDERRGKMLDTFAKLGIVQNRVLFKLGRRGVEDIDIEDLENLIGMYNAIRDGELSIDDAFPAEPKESDGKEQDEQKSPAAKTSRTDEALERMGAKKDTQDQTEIKTPRGSTIVDKTGDEDPPSQTEIEAPADEPAPEMRLELDMLMSDMREAGVDLNEINEWLTAAEISADDKRTQTQKRLQAVKASFQAWLDG